MIFGSLLVVVFGIAFAAFVARGLGEPDRRWALLAYGVHVFASVFHWAVEEFFYGISDSHQYLEQGEYLARLLNADFARFAPEVLRYALHLSSSLPFDTQDATGTETMGAVAGFFVYVGGPSLLSLSLISTCVCWYGQICIYRVARAELPEEQWSAARLGILFLPSVLFWGSGYAKESLVLGAFGYLLWSLYRVLRYRRVASLLGVTLGAIGVGVIKPYTLFPLVLAAAASIYAHVAWRGRGTPVVRPGILVLVCVLSVGGVLALGSVFPQFGADKVPQTLAYQQELWQTTDGGSTVELGSGEATSATAQLAFLPLALANAFFRPAIFEAHNAPSFGAAIETTLLALGVLSLLRRTHAAFLRREVVGTPFLVFSLVFVFIFAAAVGLATSNLGSLSRYRVPMMPFYATTILVLRARLKRREQERATVPPTVPRSARRALAR